MLHKNDEEILNTIYKNSRMAYDSTGQVMTKCRDTELSEYLRRQRDHYARTCIDARTMLKSDGLSPRQIPPMQNAMAYIGISVKTAFDRSRSHIAELMYDGTNMGIVNIARSVNKCTDVSSETKRMAEQLLSGEEKYADGLRKFL